MLNKKEKFTLFLTSYIPLWFIFIIKFFFLEKSVENKESIIFQPLTISYKKLSISSDIKTLVIVILSIIILIKFNSLKKLLKQARGKTSPLKIKKIKNISIDYLTNYFSLYLFPFFALNETDGINIFIFFLIAILAGYIYVKNNIVYINPILHFLGYSVYMIEIIKSNSDTEEAFLMTYRKRHEIEETLSNLYKFEKDFFFEKKPKI